ncbi:GyrI-like domain-containing protein [Chloroflexus sp.]|uniref:GyrI-like domain-containing protein n=1 Tax=Chloroflexus sp. TaxID=1904827 RepID=UPI00260A7C3A|nr:GyrI-like domain-containing protein [uncultured Chloroflexus sp.]
MNVEQPLLVTIKELPSITIVYTPVFLQQTQGNYSEQIRNGFENIKNWARQRGYDPSTFRLIGVPQSDGAQLVSYECALELEAATLPTDDISTRQLPGGRYAILSLAKDPTTIGATISHFFTVYIPQQRLIIDRQRPIYEVYDERVMEYCVPIL